MSNKCKATLATCLFCAKDQCDKYEYRADIIGRHLLSKHKPALLKDKSFFDALKLAVKLDKDTLTWRNKDYCFTCGATFTTPAIQANAYTDERLAEMKESYIIKHFAKNETHSKNNKRIHEALLKEAEVLQGEGSLRALSDRSPNHEGLPYGRLVPSPIPQSELEEITKLKKENEKLKKELELLKTKSSTCQARNTAYMDALEKIPEMLGKMYNYSSEQTQDLTDYFTQIKDIYIDCHVRKEVDEDDIDKLVDDVETPESLQVSAKNTIHTPETETLENAYKYGYEKNEDQHSDGVYDGEVDITPWM